MPPVRDLPGQQNNDHEHDLPSRAAAVHERIRAAGSLELERPLGALFWSGLAAGLTMSFSMVAKGIIHAQLSDPSLTRLFENFGYSIGFMMVILARQQLFTESTITAVLPVMSSPRGGQLLKLLKLWTVVLVANLLGTTIAALGLYYMPLFDPATESAFVEISKAILGYSFTEMFTKGIMAGWLIAIMVWLLPTAGEARIWVVILVTYLIGLCGFTHIIAGSTELLYLVFTGQAGIMEYLLGFALPTLLGNVVGGTFIFALISHAQIRSDMHGTK